MLPGLCFLTAVRVALDGGDPFVETTSAAHGAATSPRNRLRPPTRAQELAGNYRMGIVGWRGMALMIENPAHTVREGTDPDGKAWRNVMKAHYGYIRGTRGADGDPVDVFLGPMPESRRVWVLNQTNAAGGFDEHKVLVGFPDERAAVDAYRLSYTPGWNRFREPIPLTIEQLRWWLQWGDLKRELNPEHLPPEPETMEHTNSLPRVFWDSAAMPAAGQTVGGLLYALRVDDAATGLLLDPLTLADVYEGAERVMLDALIVQAGRLEPKMKALLRIMEAASSGVKPLAVQISEPVRRYGGVHVAVIFEMGDGQTVTAWFHNPDSTPMKLTPADDLVSWKWQLNKKDITIVVAPEKGADLNLREVARRVMRLVEKNSAAFARINAGRAARMAEIEGLKTTLGEKQAVLAGLHRRIEVALVEQADRQAAAKAKAEQEEADSQARKQKLAARAAMIVSTWKAGDTDGAWNLQQEQDDLLGLPGSTKREAFFENMTAMYPAAKPTPPALDAFATWEDALIRLVEERMEADRSDAQGIVEAQELIRGAGTLRRLFETNYTPEGAYASLFPDEPTPEITPEPTKTAADVGLEDASPEAVELLAGNAKALSTAKAIEADVKDRGGALAWSETTQEPAAPVLDSVAGGLPKLALDSLFELDGARFVRGDITYRGRPLGSVTINGTGQAFFTNADGSAFNPYMDNDDPEEGARDAAAEGIYGWTDKTSIVVAAMLHVSVTDPINEDIEAQKAKAENADQDREDGGGAWPATVLDRDNPHWKLTGNDLDEKVTPGKSSLFGVLRRGGQELNASIVYRGKNAARWYIVLTKPGQRKMLENIPFPTITGAYKLGRIASILMGYLDADEVSGWKIAPPGSEAGKEVAFNERSPQYVDWSSEVLRSVTGVGVTQSDAQGLFDARAAEMQAMFTAGEGAAAAALKLVDAANAAIQTKKSEEPAASADLAFLKDVLRGAHDALALSDLLEKIEASVMGLQEAGQLTGDADKIANDAITRWAELDQKING